MITHLLLCSHVQSELMLVQIIIEGANVRETYRRNRQTLHGMVKPFSLYCSVVHSSLLAELVCPVALPAVCLHC